ncbi:hypothetical protein GQ607_007086 [Colletotrichum asianum]|uniref:Uncharacterized protein n=1 Tax=Colletotrichum asianum TaxID=702518 RepID=A0A8H3ZMQ5_9PEZI|nr:hypothetical protein GQ607_007086 [Colletotrichum asianum]
MSIGRGKLRRVPSRDQWAGVSVLSFGPKVRGPRTHSIMLKKSDSVTPIAIRNGTGKSLRGGCWAAAPLRVWGSVTVDSSMVRPGIPGLLLLDFAQERPPRRGVQRFRPLKAAHRIAFAASSPPLRVCPKSCDDRGHPCLSPGQSLQPILGGGGQAVRVAVTRPSDTAYNCPQNLPANSPPRVSVSVLLFELVSEVRIR